MLRKQASYNLHEVLTNLSGAHQAITNLYPKVVRLDRITVASIQLGIEVDKAIFPIKTTRVQSTYKYISC